MRSRLEMRSRTAGVALPSNRSAHRSPIASRISLVLHPFDMHIITTGTRLPTPMDSEGWRSGCAGHLAIHLPLAMRLAPIRDAKEAAVIWPRWFHIRRQR